MDKQNYRTYTMAPSSAGTEAGCTRLQGGAWKTGCVNEPHTTGQVLVLLGVGLYVMMKKLGKRTVT